MASAKRNKGTGEGENYIPLLHVRDVPSKGLSTRIKGIKTKRVHQLLSKLELSYFYILDYGNKVLDIREQYPLDLDETLEIAKSLGIKHPTNPGTRKPHPMSTDFLVTVGVKINQQYLARTTKYMKALASIRVLEKFEIERVYWNRRSIDWGIVTELDIDEVVVSNIAWAHSHYDLARLAPLTKSQIAKIGKSLIDDLRSSDMPLRKVAAERDRKLNLLFGTSLNIIRHMLARKKLQADMSHPINTANSLRLIV